jgi:hypothetical protein
MNTAKIQQIGLLALATLMVTACEGHVGVDTLSDSYDQTMIDNQFPTIPVVQSDLYSQTYQSFYGTIHFQKMSSNSVRIQKTCTGGDSFCNPRGINQTSDVMLYLNNGHSIYQRTIAGNTWYTSVGTVGDSLVLSSIVNGPDGTQIQTVEEDDQVNDNPCGYGGGRGLQVQTHVMNTSNTQEWTTDSCQAYF